MAWQDRYSIEAFRAAIKRLIFEEGMTSAQAAKALGPDVTRNMVVRQRETLLGRKQTSTVTFPDSVWPSTPKRETKAEPVDALEAPVHLLKVQHEQCRAPLWPDYLRSTRRVAPEHHLFCGEKTKENSAYCRKHHALFYPPELQKRAQKPKQNNEVKDNSRHFG